MRMLSRTRWRKVNRPPFYSFLSRTIIAAPINPRNNPATEEVQPRKFNVNVDGMTCMTINKGTIQPENNRTRPRLRKKRGEFIDYLLRTRFNFLIQPASHKVIRFGFEIGWEFFIT